VLVCAVVPEQPTNLQGESISPTSIQLTWDEPRERDGGAGVAVDSYELYYNDSHLRQNVRVTIAPPVVSYRLDDLTPDTVYHIRVSARSAARGESASTPTIQVRTPDYGQNRRIISKRLHKYPLGDVVIMHVCLFVAWLVCLFVRCDYLEHWKSDFHEVSHSCSKSRLKSLY